MFQSMVPTDTDLANQALTDEKTYRLPSFSASDAVTLGLSLRKRFRASSRHARGKGLVISIQTIAGHTLFACTVGDLRGVGDVSLQSWGCIEDMVSMVKHTGHSSYYVEKGMNTMKKTPKQMGLQTEQCPGGAFPIWLENAPCCPIAIVACYSGSSQDDHNLVVTTIRDYIAKMNKNDEGLMVIPEPSPPAIPVPVREWMTDAGRSELHHRPASPN